eukprot:COSAG02_NODE_26088_length_640_cov_1.020295_1_plen_145_part_01
MSWDAQQPEASARSVPPHCGSSTVQLRTICPCIPGLMFAHGWFSVAPSVITALGRTVPRRAPTASVNVLLSPQVRAGIVLGQAVALPMVGPAVWACPGCRASTSSAAPSRGGRLRGGGVQFMRRLQCQRANVRPMGALKLLQCGR